MAVREPGSVRRGTVSRHQRLREKHMSSWWTLHARYRTSVCESDILWDVFQMQLEVSPKHVLLKCYVEFGVHTYECFLYKQQQKNTSIKFGF